MKMENWRDEKKSVWEKFEYLAQTRGDVTFLVGQPGHLGQDKEKEGEGEEIKEMEEIKASTFILCAVSSVFETMFDEKWKSQEKGVIELPDIQPKIFRYFLKVH